MSIDVIVRDARPEDGDAVRDLTLRAYEDYATIMSATSYATLQQALHDALGSDSQSHRLVAELDGMLLGSVMLYPPAVAAYGALAKAAPWPELRLLAVAPEARGLGIGELLVHECIRRLRAEGATQLGLHTATSMRGAMRLYERMGFVRAPEYDFQPEGTDLVQAYRLRLT
jgi:ribosomal protein S18 acetylase RimI-like enzyme